MIDALDNDIRKCIIKKLILNDKLSFSKLMEKQFRSNLFNYHLKWLIQNGFVIKNPDNTYSLGDAGKFLYHLLTLMKCNSENSPLEL